MTTDDFVFVTAHTYIKLIGMIKHFYYVKKYLCVLSNLETI